MDGSILSMVTDIRQWPEKDLDFGGRLSVRARAQPAR